VEISDVERDGSGPLGARRPLGDRPGGTAPATASRPGVSMNFYVVRGPAAREFDAPS